MLAASFTSLILPGVEYGGIIPVIIGMVLGVGVMDLGDRLIPHLHPGRGREGLETSRIHAVWLFILAITLHNMPEGLAVGVGFGSGNLEDALPLMLAIGIQNIPEGLAVAVAALNSGMGEYFLCRSGGNSSGFGRNSPDRVGGPGRFLSRSPSCRMPWGLRPGRCST